MEPSQLLEAVRRRSGLTQHELAVRAGTSQPVISAYERGHRDPTYGTLRRLIAAGGARLRLDAVSFAAGADRVPPPVDEVEHGRRLVDVLSLADAIPTRPRSAVLDVPRIVSVR